LATFESRSSSSRSTSTSAANAVIVFVVEKMLAIVFSVQRAVRASSAPEIDYHFAINVDRERGAEFSSDSSFEANKFRKGSKRSLQVPHSGVERSLMRPSFSNRSCSLADSSLDHPVAIKSGGRCVLVQS
jgi:hypothetical protein